MDLSQPDSPDYWERKRCMFVCMRDLLTPCLHENLWAIGETALWLQSAAAAGMFPWTLQVDYCL